MSMANQHLAKVFVAIAIVGGAILFSLAWKPDSGHPNVATIWPTTRPLPQFELTEHTGRPFLRENLEGQWSLLFFGFTHCPDICPATLQQLAIVQTKLAAAGAEVPRVILVSVDPERDTPEALAKYVQHFGAGIAGLTGSDSELRKLTAAAGIFYAKTAAADGDYSVDHSSVVLLINSDGNIHASFSAPHSIDAFAHDIPVIMSRR